MFPLRLSSEDTDRDANSIQLDYFFPKLFSSIVLQSKLLRTRFSPLSPARQEDFDRKSWDQCKVHLETVFASLRGKVSPGVEENVHEVEKMMNDHSKTVVPPTLLTYFRIL